MNEKWNEFVYELMDALRRDVEEDEYHLLIESQLKLLGWVKYKGEICHKPNIPIGNSKHIQPDILIKNEDAEQFVIEVKRPVHQLTDRERVQLESYMRQLKLRVGVYVGEHIEVFYDHPDRKHAVSVLTIPLEMDNKQGARFVELFSKDIFNKNTIVDFCEKKIEEMQRQDSLNKVKENLISDAQQNITESLLPYLMDKYGGTFSESDMMSMLSSLIFSAKPIDIAHDTQTISQNTVNKKVPEEANVEHKQQHDSTLFSINGGVFMNKRRFVYQLVKTYVEQHPSASFSELEQVFKPELQGGYGVIRTTDYIRKNDFKGSRYFTKENEILRSGDGIEFAVCSQWGIGNIMRVVELAKQLGYSIQTSNDAPHSGTSSNSNKGEVDLVSCKLTRNANAKGLFNRTTQALTVLKNSVINSHNLPAANATFIKTRNTQLEKYTQEINGTRVVTQNIEFTTPSGAAAFCIGGSSNGWREWLDDNNIKLENYRTK
jgi:hypothetical protein